LNNKNNCLKVKKWYGDGIVLPGLWLWPLFPVHNYSSLNQSSLAYIFFGLETGLFYAMADPSPNDEWLNSTSS
jgi:hypothetical protein